MKDIFLYFENILNGNQNEVNIGEKFAEYEFMRYSSGCRLINIWNQFLNNSNLRIDFELSLRNFLLLEKKTITIKNYHLSDFASQKLGLVQIGNKISARVEYPAIIKQNFIKSIYNKNISTLVPNKYILSTNEFVRNLTGFNYYKTLEQKIAVLGCLQSPYGYTTLISMSTGGGKSLITQTISYQEDGLSIIIVPTISLMLDQVKNARAIIKPKNIEEINYYNSSSDVNKIIKLMKNKTLKMLFISPEALVKNKNLIEEIDNLNKIGYLKNLIIDEAHIIVEWGSSFRIDFQCLDTFRKRFREHNSNLRTFLLSATFSRSTVELLKKDFSEGDNWTEIRCDSLRKEPQYTIVKCNSHLEKEKITIDLILRLPHPIIVYVLSPMDARRLHQKLTILGINNSKMFTGETSSTLREELVHSWTNNDFEIMIATCAFGVGVDKKDIRTVLHTYVPENANKFYQEAGRGGRDGFPCLSVLLYENNDIDAAFKMTQKALTTEKLYGRWFSMLASQNSRKLGNGIVLLDTFAKPSYLENDDFLDWANEKDVNWNVYVILLLKRHKLIDVVNVLYEKKRYIFNVQIKESLLLIESEEIKSILDNIRNIEWNLVGKEFLLMSNMLNTANVNCVSDTFTTVYNLVDEFCSGCNSHDRKNGIIDSINHLKKKIVLPIINTNDNPIDNFKKITFVDYADLKNVLNILSNYLTSIISYENLEVSTMIDKSNVNIFSVEEFYELINNFTSIFGKYIAVILPNYENKLLQIIRFIQRISELKNIKLILLIHENYIYRCDNKIITDTVESTLYSEYNLEEVLKNV